MYRVSLLLFSEYRKKLFSENFNLFCQTDVFNQTLKWTTVAVLERHEAKHDLRYARHTGRLSFPRARVTGRIVLYPRSELYVYGACIRAISGFIIRRRDNLTALTYTYIIHIKTTMNADSVPTTGIVLLRSTRDWLACHKKWMFLCGRLYETFARRHCHRRSSKLLREINTVTQKSVRPSHTYYLFHVFK